MLEQRQCCCSAAVATAATTVPTTVATCCCCHCKLAATSGLPLPLQLLLLPLLLLPLLYLPPLQLAAAAIANLLLLLGCRYHCNCCCCCCRHRCHPLAAAAIARGCMVTPMLALQLDNCSLGGVAGVGGCGGWQYLEAFLELAQGTGQVQSQAEACCSLGVIYNKQGEYVNAVQYFERFFELSRSLGEHPPPPPPAFLRPQMMRWV